MEIVQILLATLHLSWASIAAPTITPYSPGQVMIDYEDSVDIPDFTHVTAIEVRRMRKNDVELLLHVSKQDLVQGKPLPVDLDVCQRVPGIEVRIETEIGKTIVIIKSNESTYEPLLYLEDNFRNRICYENEDIVIRETERDPFTACPPELFYLSEGEELPLVVGRNRKLLGNLNGTKNIDFKINMEDFEPVFFSLNLPSCPELKRSSIGVIVIISSIIIVLLFVLVCILMIKKRRKDQPYDDKGDSIDENPDYNHDLSLGVEYTDQGIVIDHNDIY